MSSLQINLQKLSRKVYTFLDMVKKNERVFQHEKAILLLEASVFQKLFFCISKSHQPTWKDNVTFTQKLMQDISNCMCLYFIEFIHFG